MNERELSPKAKKRKELLDKMEIASKKIDEGNPNAAEQLYQLLMTLLILQLLSSIVLIQIVLYLIISSHG